MVLVTSTAIALICACSTPTSTIEPPPATPPTCPPLTGECDGVGPVTCETDLLASDAHCGACGQTCAEGTTCSKGRCQPTFAELAVGDGFACARQVSGRVACWGDNRLGQLGNGLLADHCAPAWIELPDAAVELAGSGARICALLASGQMHCWGTAFWERGSPRGAALDRSPVSGIARARHIALGPEFGCALLETGQVSCWDDHRPGAFSAVADVAGALAVHVAESTACAAVGSEIACWNRFGGGPVRVHPLPALGDIVELDHNNHEGCARYAQGAVACFTAEPNYRALEAADSLLVEVIRSPGTHVHGFLRTAAPPADLLPTWPPPTSALLCQRADSDRDGAPDDRDRCPDAAEVYNAAEDEDGCPDEAQPLVEVQPEAGLIALRERVLFEYDDADIRPESRPMLDQVASVLLHDARVPSLRIEGHYRDGELSRRLSEDRAEAVVRYLVWAGVEQSRLRYQGFGESRPIVDPSGPDAQINWRIELHIGP